MISRGLILSFSVIFLITLQGFPTAITFSGISLVTTLPAPITLPLPIVTPPQTTVFAPIQTSSSKVIGLDVHTASLVLCLGSIA